MLLRFCAGAALLCLLLSVCGYFLRPLFLKQKFLNLKGFLCRKNKTQFLRRTCTWLKKIEGNNVSKTTLGQN